MNRGLTVKIFPEIPYKSLFGLFLLVQRILPLWRTCVAFQKQRAGLDYDPDKTPMLNLVDKNRLSPFPPPPAPLLVLNGKC